MKKIEPINREEYEKMKNNLKKKKASDKEGWRYEFIQWAGKDLETSIIEMMNNMIEEKVQPDQWHWMTIKSITKKASKKMDMSYKRGLFLTNILSKCLEKILLNRRQDMIEKNMKLSPIYLAVSTKI